MCFKFAILALACLGGLAAQREPFNGRGRRLAVRAVPRIGDPVLALREGRKQHFQDIYVAKEKPNELQFGHVSETPQAWEQRFEKINLGNLQRQGKVRWGDKQGGYGEHYWDYNHDGQQGKENQQFPEYAPYEGEPQPAPPYDHFDTPLKGKREQGLRKDKHAGHNWDYNRDGQQSQENQQFPEYAPYDREPQYTQFDKRQSGKRGQGLRKDEYGGQNWDYNNEGQQGRENQQFPEYTPYDEEPQYTQFDNTQKGKRGQGLRKDKHGGYGGQNWDYNNDGQQSQENQQFPEYAPYEREPQYAPAYAHVDKTERGKREQGLLKDVEFIDDQAKSLILDGNSQRHGGNYKSADDYRGKREQHQINGDDLVYKPENGRMFDRRTGRQYELKPIYSDRDEFNF